MRPSRRRGFVIKPPPGSKPPEDHRPPDICGRKPTGSTLKTKTPLGRQMLTGQGRFDSAKERTANFYSRREGGSYFRLTVEHGAEATKDGAQRNVRGTSRDGAHYKKPSGWPMSVRGPD
jgi:hypothetical protein